MRGYQAGLVLLGLWLTACGSSVEPEDFDEKFAEALCEKYVRCGTSHDEDSCKRSLMETGFIVQNGLSTRYGSAIDSDRMHYDADAAGKCLEKLRTGSCDVYPISLRFLLEGVGMSADCRFLSGDAADGEACQWTGECGAHSVCSSLPRTGCPGTCQPRLGEGQESTVPFQCDEGLVISGSTICQRAIPEGQSCHGLGVLDAVCAPGLYCDPDSQVCRRFASAGESCDPANGRSCAWTLFCDEGTCQKRGREGDSCTAASASSILSYADCQQGLFCDADPGAAGRCRELRGEGASCRDYKECDPGLYCNGGDPESGQRGTCRRISREGDDCTGGFCTAGFYCSDASHTCQRNRQLGEACDEPSACGFGVSCTDGICGGSRTCP